MVTLLLDSAQLEVSLSVTERALAFTREDIRVDRSMIEKVQLTDDPWTWLRGVRRPGTFVPGIVAAGTWHSIAGTDFVMVRGRRPGVVVDLAEEAPYQRLVLTTRHGLSLVQALRLDVEANPPTDVVDIVTGSVQVPTAKTRGSKPRPATA